MRERSPGVRLDSYVPGVGMTVLVEQTQYFGRVQDAGVPVDGRDLATLDVWSAVSWVVDQRPVHNVTARQNDFAVMPLIEETLRSAFGVPLGHLAITLDHPVVPFSTMKRPLVMVEFTKPLDDLSDDEIDALAGEIVDAMRANLEELPTADCK